MRKKVLLVHPRLVPEGGGQAVAAWALQALAGHCELSLLTLNTPDFPALNRTFGTELNSAHFQIFSMPAIWRAMVERIPGGRELIRVSALLRQAKLLDREHRFDVIFGTHNLMDFGRRGIQYVHFPYQLVLPDEHVRRWFHRLFGLVSFYRRACARIHPITIAGIQCNVTLVNSEFIAERVRDVLGVESRVVYPPVPGGFLNIPWKERTSGFVTLGRLAPVKQLIDAICIVEALRTHGHQLTLDIVGTPEDAAYQQQLSQLVKVRADWCTLHVNLARADLLQLLSRRRFGIHTQVGEHFGIAVAELVRAGCLVFVARPGGPVEIVGHRAELTFDSIIDAVQAIDQVLRDSQQCAELREHLAQRQAIFTEQRFMTEIRAAVDEFVR